MKSKIKVSKISLLAVFLFLTVTFNFSQAVKNIPKNWKTYSDSNISFRYPANFTLKKTKEGIEVYHLSKLNHLDPCGQDDNGKEISLKHLEDFRVIFSFSGKNEKIEQEDEITKKEWEKKLQGLIDTGNLQGEVSYEAVEGCGNLSYIFPINNNNSLVVQRLIVSLYQPVAYQDEKVLMKAMLSKDILKPKDEERIFKMMMESVKIK